MRTMRTTGAAKTLRAAILLAAMAGLTGAAAAQAMVDPTRPPGALADMGGSETTGGPVLQSVMLSPGRKVAVISGETVVLGGRYGEARLVSVTETEVVLKHGAETTVLKLYPQVDKRPAGRPGSGSAGKTTVTKKIK